MPTTVDPVIPAGTFSSIDQPDVPVDASLRLRPFRDHDAPLVTAAFDDPDVRRWHGFRIDTPEEAQQWIDRTHTQWVEEKSVNWAIVDADDVLLGRIALYVAFRRGTSEIAYWVLPSARRRSVAVRSVLAVTEWAHKWLGVQRILLQHSVHNEGSCAVARRAGYAVEGTARQQDLHDDGWHDMHQHAHLAGE